MLRPRDPWGVATIDTRIRATQAHVSAVSGGCSGFGQGLRFDLLPEHVLNLIGQQLLIFFRGDPVFPAGSSELADGGPELFALRRSHPGELVDVTLGEIHQRVVAPVPVLVPRCGEGERFGDLGHTAPFGVGGNDLIVVQGVASGPQW